MSIGSRIKGRAIAAFLGPTGRGARELFSAARRRITGEPVRLEFFHDIIDPWSYLAAQAVDRLVKAYPGVELAVHVVSPPASDVDPAPEMRARHAVRDARELAAYWDVEFAGKKEADPTLLRKVSTSLIRPRPAVEQLKAILDLCGALWAADGKRVDALLGDLGSESQAGIGPSLATAYGELRDRGHYQGGMIAYRGQWYWGIDRIGYLERDLAQDAGVDPVGVIARRADAERGPVRLAAGDAPLVLDMWFSFRSPYSYLALERISEVLSGSGATVELRLRPVAPMVERGLQVPRIKRLYIVEDAKREADRLGIPFGNLCDPLGKAVTHCLAIAKHAIAAGKGLAFARSAMRGICSEAMDLADYVDLRRVVERAEIGWDDARAALADPEAASWAAANAADLAVVGLWGVPSFRVGDLVMWGQDRLDLLADRLRRHVAATSVPAPADAGRDSA
jgi:2-hydroxychromene-2-carboxylate isomerase